MSMRHRIILLATSVCGALVLFCPVSGSSPSVQLGPLVSAAPPLFVPSPLVESGESPLMEALRREAGLALGQLQGRESQ